MGRPGSYDEAVDRYCTDCAGTELTPDMPVSVTPSHPVYGNADGVVTAAWLDTTEDNVPMVDVMLDNGTGISVRCDEVESAYAW